MTAGHDRRIRGAAGQRARKRRLKAHPLCAHCEAEGIVRPTDIIDHVLALALGGEDVDDNVQGLCHWHNAIKTAAEDASAGGGAPNPDWLGKSASPAVVIAGPPCGGKSHLAAELLKPADRLVDLDEIAKTIDPAFDRTWTPDLVNKALRVRNALLGEATRRPLPQGGRLILIVAAPTAAERSWWATRLGATLFVRDPGEAIARARAMERDGRDDHVRAYYKRSREAWTPKRVRLARQGFDEDGFPIDPGSSDQDASAGPRPGRKNEGKR